MERQSYGHILSSREGPMPKMRHTRLRLGSRWEAKATRLESVPLALLPALRLRHSLPSSADLPADWLSPMRLNRTPSKFLAFDESSFTLITCTRISLVYTEWTASCAALIACEERCISCLRCAASHNEISTAV